MTTYQRVGKLFVDTFIYVLPFVLLCVAFEFFFTRIMLSGQTGQISKMLAIILLLLVAGLFYCFVMLAVYNRYHDKPTNYRLTFREGLKRYPEFLLSQIILVIPLLVISSLAFIPEFLSPNTASTPNVLSKTLVVIGLSLAVVYLLFCLYFYISPVQIINEKHSALAGLKRSFYLVRGYWIDTFILIFSLALVVVVLEWLFRFILGDYASELARLLTFSLGACLVIVHCDHLEQAHAQDNDKPSIVPSQENH